MPYVGIDAKNDIRLNATSDLDLTSDSTTIKFGADDDVTLTHVHNTGLTLNSTNKIMFNDASQFIQGSSATVLSLGATDEIDLTATTIDMNGNVDLAGYINFSGTASSFASISQPRIFRSGSSSGSFPFDAFGHLILQSRGDGSNRDIVFATGTSGANKSVIDDAGNFGIGDISPTKPLTLGTTTPVMLFDDQNSRTMEIRGPSSTHNASILTTYAADLLLGTNSDEKMRIDTSGRVGIGGVPNTNWRDDIANQEVLMLGTEATFYSDGGLTTELFNNAFVNDDDDFKNISNRGASRYFQYSGAHKWFTAASASAGTTITSEIQTTPKMTLDISGNLLVGRTSLGISNTGHTLAAAGYVEFTRDGAAVLNVGRNSSFGDIADFWKDGANVGSIGSPFGSELYIEAVGSNSSGLLFTSGNSIQPRKNSAADNGNIDLGTSGNKFKDAHFAGAVDCAEITYDKANSSAGNSGLNVSAQYSYDDNNTNTIGSNFHNNHTFIYINTNAGFTVVPVLSNGGAGIAWANYLWDPDNQTWTSANDMTFTQSGTSGNTFRIQISAGQGTGTIQRTSGSMAYQVYISRPAGGS